MKQSLPDYDSSAITGDIYFIRSVIDRIEQANTREKELRETAAIGLESVRDALRRSQYSEAIRQASCIAKDTLNRTELQELMDTMWSAALNVSDDSEVELNAYELVIQIANILATQNTSEKSLRQRLASALIMKGITLGSLDRGEEEIVAYDEVVKRFGDATEPAIRERVASALVNKGITLGSLNRSEEEIVAYDDVVKRFAAMQPSRTYVSGWHRRLLIRASRLALSIEARKKLPLIMRW